MTRFDGVIQQIDSCILNSLARASCTATDVCKMLNNFLDTYRISLFTVCWRFNELQRGQLIYCNCMESPAIDSFFALAQPNDDLPIFSLSDEIVEAAAEEADLPILPYPSDALNYLSIEGDFFVIHLHEEDMLLLHIAPSAEPDSMDIIEEEDVQEQDVADDKQAVENAFDTATVTIETEDSLPNDTTESVQIDDADGAVEQTVLTDEDKPQEDDGASCEEQAPTADEATDADGAEQETLVEQERYAEAQDDATLAQEGEYDETADEVHKDVQPQANSEDETQDDTPVCEDYSTLPTEGADGRNDAETVVQEDDFDAFDVRQDVERDAAWQVGTQEEVQDDAADVDAFQDNAPVAEEMDADDAEAKMIDISVQENVAEGIEKDESEQSIEEEQDSFTAESAASDLGQTEDAQVDVNVQENGQNSDSFVDNYTYAVISTADSAEDAVDAQDDIQDALQDEQITVDAVQEQAVTDEWTGSEDMDATDEQEQEQDVSAIEAEMVDLARENAASQAQDEDALPEDDDFSAAAIVNEQDQETAAQAEQEQTATTQLLVTADTAPQTKAPSNADLWSMDFSQDEEEPVTQAEQTQVTEPTQQQATQTQQTAASVEQTSVEVEQTAVHTRPVDVKPAYTTPLRAQDVATMADENAAVMDEKKLNAMRALGLWQPEEIVEEEPVVEQVEQVEEEEEQDQTQETPAVEEKTEYFSPVRRPENKLEVYLQKEENDQQFSFKSLLSNVFKECAPPQAEEEDEAAVLDKPITNFGEFREEMRKKGFTVKQYVAESTYQYYTHNYINVNRIKFVTSILTYLVGFVMIAIAYLALDRFAGLGLKAYIAAAAALLVVPGFYGICYLSFRDRRAPANFSFKLSLVTSFIAALLIMMVFLILGFFIFGANISEVNTLVAPIFYPMGLLSLMPISVIIYALLYRSKRFHL